MLVNEAVRNQSEQQLSIITFHFIPQTVFDTRIYRYSYKWVPSVQDIQKSPIEKKNPIAAAPIHPIHVCETRWLYLWAIYISC